MAKGRLGLGTGIGPRILATVAVAGISSFFVYRGVTRGSSGSRENETTADRNATVREAPSGRKVTFSTNWYAQAEHGGFYQALAKGFYREKGLDVEIRMGGPQVNGVQLLVAGTVDFHMGAGNEALRAVEEGLPCVTVAAIFQKDLQVLMAHPGQGNDTLPALKGKPILVSATANTSYWPFLKARFGFTDDQKRPYNFNLGPFLADKGAIQQGYLTSEPFTVEKQAGFKPVVHLLADHGYSPYATTIETTTALHEKDPQLVRDFVDASLQGWYSYLEDPAEANALIKRDNPEMTDELLAYSVGRLKEMGVLDSGDARTLGIGAMTDARWKEYFDAMVSMGMFKATTPWQKAYTLAYVNKGIPPATPAAVP